MDDGSRCFWRIAIGTCPVSAIASIAVTGPFVDEDGRVDPAGELAQLGERGTQLRFGRVEPAVAVAEQPRIVEQLGPVDEHSDCTPAAHQRGHGAAVAASGSS